jgi:hypothetical protein
MSIASAHASAFYSEVAKSGKIWAIKDPDGFPAPMTFNGKRSMPFWSLESRVQKIIENLPAYAGFTPVAIEWSVFCERWVPGLAKDGLLTGINWSGENAVGFDIHPQDLQVNVEALRNGNAPNKA